MQHTEQLKLAQENESLRFEKEQHQQARIQVEKHNESLKQEKARLETRLLEALQKHHTHQAATPVAASHAGGRFIESKSAISVPMTASVLALENSDRSIAELIDFVKDLEKHVVIVCQRSQQQDASGGSFEKTVSYLQQLDKKLHAGKVSKTRMVTDTLAHLKGRITWAQVRIPSSPSHRTDALAVFSSVVVFLFRQLHVSINVAIKQQIEVSDVGYMFVQESLPELIGEFDGAMHEVSRRSMDLSKMKELSRAALDEEHSAVGELETHLKCVGVSMRAHLHSIFEEVNRWPGPIQGLLTHKATKEELSELDADTESKPLAAFSLTAGENQFCYIYPASVHIFMNTVHGDSGV